MNTACHAYLKSSARPVLAVFALLLLVGLSSGPAAGAATPDAWSSYSGWQVTSFKVEGAPADMAGDLQRGLALTGQWRLLRGRERPSFSVGTLAEDLARIRLFLAVRGYPAARVVPTAEPNPEARQLALLITIEPGAVVRIGEINYAGWPESVALPDTSESRILRVGDVFTDEAVAASVAAVRGGLRNAGYARVAISHEIRPLGPARVAIDLAINAGDFFVIDEVVVSGCSDDLVGLAQRVINIKPGTEFSAARLADAALDLRVTQLFRQVELATEPISPGHLRLNATLLDGRMRTWDASIGTWADNPWKVRSSWTHRNLFGRGRGFNARGAFATHEANLGVGVFWLGWLSPRARTRVGLDAIKRSEDAFDSEEFRMEVLQSYRPRQRDILNVGTAVSENRIEEKLPGSNDIPEAQGRLWEFWLDRKWDRTNDPIYPARGGFFKVAATFAEPWVLSVVPYVSLQLDAAGYLDLPAGSIFSGRIRAGAAQPIDAGTEVLATRRFYAGGYNSHRGYGRHGLGPRDDAGDARGGQAVGLLSGEIRLPMIWILEGGLFVDGGNVWRRIEEVNPADFPVAVGATVGLHSPLGPIRVGYAVNVAGLVPGEPRELWHFGIGYPW